MWKPPADSPIIIRRSALGDAQSRCCSAASAVGSVGGVQYVGHECAHDYHHACEPAAVQAHAAPSNELEALAATTFTEVFNLDKVGIDDEFFELGGDSLLAEVSSLALSERTSVPLQPSAFVELASPRE